MQVGLLQMPVLETVSTGKLRKMPILENAGTGNCQYWKMPVLENDSTGKCRYWKMPELENDCSMFRMRSKCFMLLYMFRMTSKRV